MYNPEILRLQNQINKLKQIYETRKDKREKLVEHMNNLDERLEKLERTINRLNIQDNKNDIKNHKTRLINKELIKICIKNCIKNILSTGLLLVVLNFIIWKFQFFLLQLLTISIIHIALSNRDYKKYREEIPKNKKTIKKELENIEREYQEVKEKRITIGQKYKQVREREVSAYNVYKTYNQLASDRINYLNLQSLNQPIVNNNIELDDIYHKISSYWGDYFEDNETTKKILDNQLKKYLIDKISEINYELYKSGELEKLTTEELVTILANYIPKCRHNKTISHIIHAILGYASNMQLYSIVWLEENDESLVASPSITFNENDKWNELKTHKNTDYLKIFNKVYNTFQNEFMKKSPSKTRIKY